MKNPLNSDNIRLTRHPLLDLLLTKWRKSRTKGAFGKPRGDYRPFVRWNEMISKARPSYSRRRTAELLTRPTTHASKES